MRPPVSVVLPFLGDEAQAREALARLAAIRLREGDEVLVADNTPSGLVAGLAGSEAKVVAAPEQRSASYARNVAAAVAKGDWLLFLDADCLPPPGLLDAYFDPPPAERCAIVAGEISGDPDQAHVLARWSRSRRGPWVGGLVAAGQRPAAISANMLVRRAAFEQAGGFELGGGADFDLSWRLQDDGWELELRPAALVLHRDRETLRAVGDQARAYGSHQRHLRRRHGSLIARPPLLRPLARSLGGSLVWLLRGERERAVFALTDGFYATNAWIGALTGGPTRRRAD